MKNNIFNVFLLEKPCAILSVLRNSQEKNYASEIARKVDCTYSHVHKILLFLKKESLISFEKQSRINKIILTEKGGEIAENLEKIKELFI